MKAASFTDTVYLKGNYEENTVEITLIYVKSYLTFSDPCLQ
jgi:hypothetical protein